MISLRTRLALWSVGVLGLSFVAFGQIVYVAVQTALLQNVDTALADRAQRTSLYIVAAESAPYFVRENLRKTLSNFTSSDMVLEATALDGRVLARSPTWSLGSLGGVGSVGALRPAGAAPARATTVGDAWRLYVTPLYAGRTLAGYLSVAGSLATMHQALATLRRGLLAVGLLALCLAAAVVLWLARRALRPVAAITRTAQAITVSGQVSQRVPYSGPADEIGHLAATFNEMLARLDETQTAQKRFVADASHELRTPLTSILGSAEALARRPDAPPEERGEAVADIIAEARRLARLVAGLLSLARADGGQQLACEAILLEGVTGEMVARVTAAHPGRALEVTVLTPASVRADPDRLRELVLILLNNAVTYAPPAAPVTCTIDVAEGCGRLRVRDHGAGISARDLPHIFERFYRAPSARRYDQGGTGLGLAIAHWIVQQHQGHIDVHSVEGEGTTVTVLLPLAAGAPDGDHC